MKKELKVTEQEREDFAMLGTIKQNNSSLMQEQTMDDESKKYVPIRSKETQSMNKFQPLSVNSMYKSDFNS